MTRDVEMELSLWEMLLAVKRHWVMVLLCMVVCAVLGGVLGYVRISSGIGEVSQTDPGAATEDLSKISKEHVEYAEELFKENKAQTEEFDAFNKEQVESLRAEWDHLKDIRANDPLMKLDPLNADVERITFSFEKGSHASMVYDWIQEADEKSLFGDAAEDIVKHKNDLIIINGVSATGTANAGLGAGGSEYSGETTVSVIAVDGFDAKKAVTYLKSWISSKASAVGFSVVAVSSSHLSGENAYVKAYQQSITDRMTDIQNRLAGLYQAAISVVAPPAFENVADDSVSAADTVVDTAAGVSLKDLMKYVLIGFVVGLIAGAAIAIFLTLKKGCVLSMRQVEETFGLELLSDCSSDKGASADILNANLDVMVGEGTAVMLLSSYADAESSVSSLVSAWNDGGSREFIAGRDIIDDSDTIDALSGVEGILLGVKIGESKLTDIQRVLIRAKKLGKAVLGYVVM